MTYGEKDDYQYNYLDNYERFADQVNGALFGGRQVVKPEELEPANAKSVYLGKEAGARKDYENTTDKARTWRGRLIHIITIRYGNDKEQLRKVMEENKEAYINMDSETRELIEVMTGKKHLHQYKTIENGKERFNMLKAFEDMKAEGKIEGKIESILELLEEFGQIPLRVVEVVNAEDNPDVLSKWLKSAAKATSIAEFEANM